MLSQRTVGTAVPLVAAVLLARLAPQDGASTDAPGGTTTPAAAAWLSGGWAYFLVFAWG
jgi:hypothetical protein